MKLTHKFRNTIMRAYKLDIIHWKQIITMSVVTHTTTGQRLPVNLSLNIIH